MDMSSDWITGGELLDKGIQIFELTSAIREERMSCTDPVSGRPVLDVNTSRAVPKYTMLTEAYAAYVAGQHASGQKTNEEEFAHDVASNHGIYSKEEIREMQTRARQADENCARVVLEVAVTYPSGTHQFDFDSTNHRRGVFIEIIRGLLFSRADVAVCFPRLAGKPSSQEGQPGFAMVDSPQEVGQAAPMVGVEAEGARNMADAQIFADKMKGQRPRPSNSEIAKAVDAQYPGLTHPALGGLLAKEGDRRNPKADSQRGRRARGHSY